MTKQTQEQVAQTLEDSGLFDWSEGVIWLDPNYNAHPQPRDQFEGDPYLASYQAEGLLNELHLIAGRFDWQSSGEEIQLFHNGDWFIFNTGSRVDNLNAALAWCCDNMRAELELAVEGVKG